MLIGKNGIIGSAGQASETTKDVSEDEQLKLAVADALIYGTGTLTTDNVRQGLISEFGENKVTGTTFTGTGPWKFKGERKTYTIEKNGKITTGETTKLTKAGTPVAKPEGWLDTTGAIADGAGNAIPLSNGYYYVGGDYDTGLVISDKEKDTLDATGVDSGNQFVWIPVDKDDIIKDGENVTGIKRYDWDTSTGEIKETDLSSDYTEPYYGAPENGWEKTEYNLMVASVAKYGGFYIGRYEAGVNQTNFRNAETAAQDVVVKKGVAPYNYVKWGKSMTEEGNGTTKNETGAVYLARNKYIGDKTGVTSTLVYGVQWDAMCRYIGANKAKMACSQSIVGSTGNNPEDVARNIYDLAGNCMEWTMEAFGNYSSRVKRGGVFSLDYPVCKRLGDMSCGAPFYDDSYSFRIALYVK